MDRDAAYLEGLVHELQQLPAETPWVEFKHNNENPQEIGEYLSALSNAAALSGKSHAYLVWGIEDGTHAVLGTKFVPATAKRGGEQLESWLARLLTPRLHFQFHSVIVEGRPVVILEIPRANDRPTAFEGKEMIRIGANKKPLREYPEQERALWRCFDQVPFEERVAVSGLAGGDAVALLDFPAYFQLLGMPLPADQAGILARLEGDGLLRRNDAGQWGVTNLGALLFGRDLNAFKGLARKAVRVIVYEGRGKLKTLREHEDHRGYAAGFSALIDHLNALLPRNEVVGRALRREVPMYPELAVRELVANALIHQDLSITGTGPTIEVFADRMEITNPGVPLVSIERFIDSPPRSRNEAVASLMRRMGICEERGSGVDKVVSETELYQLPAPSFEVPDGATRVVLYAPRPLNDMDRADRTRACYLHACLRYVERNPMSNASLRERFGIEPQNSAVASRIIKDALTAGQIRPYDPEQGYRNARYLPWWA